MGYRAFLIHLYFSFIGFLSESTKTIIKHIKDFKPVIVRKEAALCWHSLLAKLECCCFHCPPPSWRISALVTLALECFTLLLCVFSLFLLTPSTSRAQRSLSSDSACKRSPLDYV